MVSDLWSRVDPKELAIVKEAIAEHPVRVGELANKLGIDVFRSPLPPKISGMIRPKGDGDGYEIRVNKYEVPERQRFTLAHEIAHFLLHKSDIRAGVVDSVMYRSALTSRKEAEANRVAADIVMPMGAVRRELSALGGVPTEEVAKELALRFKVSLPAMRVRLGLS
ncbi:ImmA/IrrE family metallo-endopeptidase [Brevundimonas sp.]|jgi:Zn-dependent peptidase ImmA (M78 family)|uniref:ImmA/IrrE family metallo-endopeptidase n=1 Tax=Brevundimonas sp. TaxID=1871086 RepID=UPI00391A5279